MVDEFTNNQLGTPAKTTTELLSRDYSTLIKILQNSYQETTELLSRETTSLQDACQQK